MSLLNPDDPLLPPVPPPLPHLPPIQGSIQDIFGLIGRPLLQNPEVKEVWFNNKTITLDGYTFTGCRFDNCTLNLSSSNFSIVRCYIDDSTQIYYSGEILKVIRLFNRQYDWFYKEAPIFAPKRNADGTITITRDTLLTK